MLLVFETGKKIFINGLPSPRAWLG